MHLGPVGGVGMSGFTIPIPRAWAEDYVNMVDSAIDYVGQRALKNEPLEFDEWRHVNKTLMLMKLAIEYSMRAEEGIK